MAPGDRRLKVRIVTPERVVFDGDVDSVIATAFDGQFGVLPGHAPMVAQLGIGEFRVQQGDRLTWFVLGSGFLHVLDDVVSVLTAYAEAANEIDVESAQRFEIMAAENPLLQGTILGDEQRKRLGEIRERVARRTE